MDPLAGSPWSRPETVAGFSASPPNDDLLRFARAELGRAGRGRALDLGCGAGRNAVPLSEDGWRVLGIDLSLPMLHAARERARAAPCAGRLTVALAPMGALRQRSKTSVRWTAGLLFVAAVTMAVARYLG